MSAMRLLLGALVKELAGLKWLRDLDLAGTLVTETGVAQLKHVLPNCRIHR
jgi:hypothetical protein